MSTTAICRREILLRHDKMYQSQRLFTYHGADWGQEMAPIQSPQNVAGTTPKQQWPMTYWLLLKALCLFHGRKVVTSRKCQICRIQQLQAEQYQSERESALGLDDDVDDDDEHRLGDEDIDEVPEDERDQICDICSSMWWDADGKSLEYTEEDIGITSWNHRGSFYLSQFLLLANIAFLAYDGVTYLIECWGRDDQLMHLISFSTYLLNISAIPILCLIANFRNVNPTNHVSNFAWTSALHPRSIVKSFQYLNPGRNGVIKKPFLVVCIFWPLFNSVYRACIYVFLVEEHDFHNDITLVTDGIAAQLWGSFCYLLILLRTSIRVQLNLDIVFLRHHLGDVDICRQRLATSLREYGSLCNLCGKWMLFTMFLTSIGFATQINWNYLFYTGEQLPVYIYTNHVNAMIWSERFMFMILPLVAVRGFDLSRIWEDFMTRICEIRCDKYHDFWEKIMKFLTREFNPVKRVVEMTILFTAISLYMALKVGDPGTNDWGVIVKNETSSTIQ